MNGDKLFLDTNIIIYLLKGDQTLTTFLNGKQFFISFVSQLELLSFKEITDKEINLIKDFLNHCTVIDINNTIKDLTIDLRKNYNLKLPDSIVSATAIYLDIPLITADKQIRKIELIDTIIYEP